MKHIYIYIIRYMYIYKLNTIYIFIYTYEWRTTLLSAMDHGPSGWSPVGCEGLYL